MEGFQCMVSQGQLQELNKRDGDHFKKFENYRLKIRKLESNLKLNKNIISIFLLTSQIALLSNHNPINLP